MEAMLGSYRLSLRVLLYVTFFMCFTSYLDAQSISRTLVKETSDTTVYFYAGFELQNGLTVLTESDSISTTKERLESIIFQLVSTNKVRVLKSAKEQLKGVPFKLKSDKGMEMFKFFPSSEEIKSQRDKLEGLKKQSIFKLIDFQFIPPSLNSGPGNPVIR